MKFGPRPTGDAAGAVLAHTLRVGDGVLKKGRRLGEKDLSRLLQAGYEEVVVARLEPGDIGEDDAAAALGAVLAGDAVEAADAFTGRCNLYAQAPGLFAVARERVDALNRIDEGLTLATLPPDSVVDAGTMVATAKVIPFALRESVLERALACGRGEGPLLRVSPFRPLRAGLLLTELAGTRIAVLDRASESQRVRLERLGGEIARELRCRHEVAAVCDGIQTLLAAGCDPILMLGASAIVDRGDVLPSALEMAGGTIRRLGMPVDPGNLLLLAEHGDTHVIGVPGCARSLKPSGFDTVLARIAANLPVSPENLSAMGTGGLLKEMPGRPQPREGEMQGDESRLAGERGVGGVVLAAGQSSRMPGANKLLCDVDGAPMVTRVVDTLLASEIAPVVVVTGHESEAVRAALADRPVSFAHNARYREGMSGSLRVGLEALEGRVDAALICLGDMPWVGPEVFRALLAAYQPVDPRICVPVHDRKRGNPVLWPASYFASIREIRGDQGARRLLDEHADDIQFVSVGDDGINLDIDTPEALAALRDRSASA